MEWRLRGPKGMGGCATRSPARNTSTVDSVTLMLTSLPTSRWLTEQQFHL